ncbi:Ethanolamine-phosphate cytidylyltransferase [Actinomortierella ambigua]|uniref:ethanolamine-phosphate cytidylyltransferase n=1 Tax=Actinomortierella ambigua TaxID=1343610 RepID=A0A9P6Q0U2_9FUNG|nr:Ethanolamine-phosphate cytidylyltransferase [Actinomortierella ambigua]
MTNNSTNTTTTATASAGKKRPIRIWVDGCFDVTHHGHFNALRQAKAMGDYLVVGVHSDAEIEKNKGPTVMKEDERYAAVAACKWVDEVVPNAPYLTSLEWMDRYNCDFCVHGDDITTMADGTDCYQEVKDAGRYRECKRTQDVSTTELVGRMLLMTRDHHKRRLSNATSTLSSVNTEELGSFTAGANKSTVNTKVSHFLPTSRKIVQFSEGREPKAGDKVVYVDGTFDLFHTGHIEFLKRAKQMGDYLLVGIHDDQTVNAIKGVNYPLMNLHERVLSVLACRYVDEVVIGAPYSVTDQVLEKVYKVDLVVHGNTPSLKDLNGEDPYKLPKERGIYIEIENPQNSVTTESIIDRIIAHRKVYEDRQRRKEQKALLEREAEAAEKAAKSATEATSA